MKADNEATAEEKTNNQTPTPIGKEQIRIEYFKTQWEKKPRRSVHMKEWRSTDELEGEYLPPDMIIKSQGGDESAEARRRGFNIIESAAKLGGKFLRWIRQIKGLEFFKVTLKHREAFEQKCPDQSVHVSFLKVS